MKKSQVILTQYSPLLAVDSKLVGGDGKPVESPRVFSLCRCGESGYKPMCDGSHTTVGFFGERNNSAKSNQNTMLARALLLFLIATSVWGMVHVENWNQSSERMMSQSMSPMPRQWKRLSKQFKNAHPER